MSVKALDDSRRQIEISDELESMFHILIYEAVTYLPSNCMDLEDFILQYFDASERSGLEFMCGPTKRNSMTNGQINCKGGTPLLFHCPTVKKRLPRRASPSCPREPPSSGTATTTTANTSHPIQHILNQALLLFRAHYSGHAAPGSMKSSRKRRSDVKKKAADVALAGRWGGRQITVMAFKNDEKLIRLAAEQLKTHDAFGALLHQVYQAFVWPAKDKLANQVDPKYNALKRLAQINDVDLEMDHRVSKKRVAGSDA